MIGPAPLLAVIVGLFHVSAYVFIRGRAGARLPLLVVAAVLGAWAGDTVGSRMAIDPIRIGEFHLLSASLVAWLGIGLVAVVSVLAPERRERIPEEGVSTVLTRSGASSSASAESDDRATPSRPTDASTRGSTVEPEPQAPR